MRIEFGRWCSGIWPELSASWRGKHHHGKNSNQTRNARSQTPNFHSTPTQLTLLIPGHYAARGQRENIYMITPSHFQPSDGRTILCKRILCSAGSRPGLPVTTT